MCANVLNVSEQLIKCVLLSSTLTNQVQSAFCQCFPAIRYVSTGLLTVEYVSYLWVYVRM